jgi:hypothetical protein
MRGACPESAHHGQETGMGDASNCIAVRVGDHSKSIGDWMNAYFAAATLLLLPFEAVAFRLAFHPEWLVIAAFLTVQTFVFWSIALLLQRWVPGRFTASFR